VTSSPPRILLPLDGSRLAESAIPAATEIAVGWGADLILLHVLELRAPETVHGEPHLAELREARSYLARVESDLREIGIRVDAHAHEPGVPDVAHGLARHADELQADLIVLCSHGSGGLRDFLLGNIPQQTLKRAARPVLLVRPPVPRGGWGLGKRPWVVAVEPSAHGPSALPLVAELCRALDVPVQLVTVVPTRKTLSPDRRVAADLAPRTASSLLDMEERDAGDYLEKLAVGLRAVGLDVGVRLARGARVREVLRELDRKDAALLVVATHRKVGIAGLLAGSFAVGIANKTPCPILLVPAEEMD
jgi:nucleotide-binding universal stress UspA family protein